MKTVYLKYNPKTLEVKGGLEDYNPFGFEVEE